MSLRVACCRPRSIPTASTARQPGKTIWDLTEQRLAGASQIVANLFHQVVQSVQQGVAWAGENRGDDRATESWLVARS